MTLRQGDVFAAPDGSKWEVTRTETYDGYYEEITATPVVEPVQELVPLEGWESDGQA